MSRIGRRTIQIPDDVQIQISENSLVAKGPKGELHLDLHPKVTVEINDKNLNVKVQNPEIKTEKALWGLFGSLINNIVIGVTKGFEKKLEVNGVGYKVSMAGNVLTLNVGYSYPINFTLPENITGEVEKNIITIHGIDKQLVGQVAADIRKVRKPEPYKGKGIKYMEEIIRRKAGKASAKSS